jgi:hypothetical protein
MAEWCQSGQLSREVAMASARRAARRAGLFVSGDLAEALGRVASVAITFESGPEFGSACRNTLWHSQWTPPLGQLGKPTATFITYRCKFRVDD